MLGMLLFSSVLMLANIFFRAGFPTWLQSPINCGAFAMFAGMIIVPVVSLFTPKPDKELVDSAFACYERNRSATEDSTWKVIRNISNIYIPFTTKPPCAITTEVIKHKEVIYGIKASQRPR